MASKYYAKSDGFGFHIVRKTKDNNSLCGYMIPEKVSYQVILHYPFSGHLMCNECKRIADKEIKYAEREESRSNRKKHLERLVKMSNLELLEEYDYNNYCSDEVYDEYRYNVTRDYFIHKLKLCRFLK